MPRNRQCSPPRVVILAVVAITALPLTAVRGGDDPAPVAVLHHAQNSQRMAADALIDALDQASIPNVRFELPITEGGPDEDQALTDLNEAGPAIVASAGTKATTLALESLSPTVPVVFFMVPNALDAAFTSPGSPHQRRVTGVTTDISPDAQMIRIRTISSAVQTVGVLSSERTARTVARLARIGSKHGISVISIGANKDDFMPAIDELNKRGCDAVLMIPDSRVYNSVSVQRLLLWGLRQKKPVYGFSANVVQAGALAGWYCDIEAAGRQTAHLIQAILNGGDVPNLGIHYPDKIDDAVNLRTSEMIGIRLPLDRLPADTVEYGAE